MTRKARAACLVILLLLSGATGGMAQSASDALVTYRGFERVEDTIGYQEGTELAVATVNILGGYFATDMWGNYTADIDVRNLLHGYGTVARIMEMEMMLDGTVVAGTQVSVAGNGNRTYTISLMENLQYNDGAPITAKDYLFSLLLCGSPEIAELGGMPHSLIHLEGYEDYLSGASEAFSGVRLLSEHAFSLEIQAEYLPYFYGLAYLDIIPYPMHVIAPGCDIFDDGSGAYIARGETAASLDASVLGFEPGVFSTQMLLATMLDPESGYVFNPKVTSGPYSLESFDKASGKAAFSLNRKYVGNFEGQKPHIETLTLETVANEDLKEALTSGKIGLVNKVTDGDTAMELLALADMLMGKPYPRTGFAFLSFACESGITSDAAVRRAIAHCVDQTSIVSAVSPYAMPVYGYYGMGQWFPVYVAEADGARPALDVPAEIAAVAVPYDVQAAGTLLAKADWAYGADGNEYKEGVRYRKADDGTLLPLTIRWAKSNDSNTSDTIAEHLLPAMEQAGFDVQVTEMPFDTMMRHYYRLDDRGYDMFFLATNFLHEYDPYFDYHLSDGYQGSGNTTGLRDETLAALALDLRTTETYDVYSYASKWVEFHKRWIELMPVAPIYSNMYFDFHIPQLQGYEVTLITWANAILYAWIDETVELPAAASPSTAISPPQTVDTSPGNDGEMRSINDF